MVIIGHRSSRSTFGANEDISINSQTSSFRCPSHYNSESIEVLLCNEHMTQVDLRININYPRVFLLVER